MHFPCAEHWRQLHSTNTLERINKGLKRRARVVGIFPNHGSLVRMVATLLQEQDDEWQIAESALLQYRIDAPDRQSD